MSILSKQLQTREIITKAVVGKGRKFSTVTHTVTPPNRPTSILGAWVINHRYEAVRSGDGIEVVGSYDLNIWYSYNKNSQTDVAKETVTYVDNVALSSMDPNHLPSTEEVYAESTHEPNCIEADISSNGTSVVLRVEREFKVQLIAETKVCVAVVPGGCDDDLKDDNGLDDGLDGDFADDDLIDDL
ncbi:outer spore coat protein CotE [Paenibacillus pasadenensis]|uniref:outer spore coat protein CotE n=1 Tax=Paenibacillus pasadenensis TaxID=217090 RepID=UPI00203FDDDB|nr:outer spore coat protein CotE [Paenibacillus pasadenensis]MCM3748982.1 outer spore coat protein CotE [Paenibacillus pasadenensis]